MNLDQLARRMRRWLQDPDGEDYDLDTVIQPTVDDVIKENYDTLVKTVPRYYLSTYNFTGRVDAITDTDNERYYLPDDFYGMGNLRRTDISNKPKLRFIANMLDQDKFKLGAAYPFYDPDPNVPLITTDTWTLYDNESLRILPAPASESYTFTLSYFRKWEEALTGTDEVDIPDQATIYVAAQAALDILISENDQVAPTLMGRLTGIIEGFKKSGETKIDGNSSVPEVERWW